MKVKTYNPKNQSLVKIQADLQTLSDYEDEQLFSSASSAGDSSISPEKRIFGKTAVRKTPFTKNLKTNQSDRLKSRKNSKKLQTKNLTTHKNDIQPDLPTACSESSYTSWVSTSQEPIFQIIASKTPSNTYKMFDDQYDSESTQTKKNELTAKHVIEKGEKKLEISKGTAENNEYLINSEINEKITQTTVSAPGGHYWPADLTTPESAYTKHQNICATNASTNASSVLPTPTCSDGTMNNGQNHKGILHCYENNQKFSCSTRNDREMIDKQDNTPSYHNKKKFRRQKRMFVCKVFLLCFLIPFSFLIILASLFLTGLYVGIKTTNHKPLVQTGYIKQIEPQELYIRTMKIDDVTDGEPNFTTMFFVRSQYESAVNLYNPLSIDIKLKQISGNFFIDPDHTVDIRKETKLDTATLTTMSIGSEQLKEILDSNIKSLMYSDIIKNQTPGLIYINFDDSPVKLNNLKNSIRSDNIFVEIGPYLHNSFEHKLTNLTPTNIQNVHNVLHEGISEKSIINNNNNDEKIEKSVSERRLRGSISKSTRIYSTLQDTLKPVSNKIRGGQLEIIQVPERLLAKETTPLIVRFEAVTQVPEHLLKFYKSKINDVEDENNHDEELIVETNGIEHPFSFEFKEMQIEIWRIKLSIPTFAVHSFLLPASTSFLSMFFSENRRSIDH